MRHARVLGDVDQQLARGPIHQGAHGLLEQVRIAVIIDAHGNPVHPLDLLGQRVQGWPETQRA